MVYISNIVWDLIFPEKCMLCGKIISGQTEGVCAECRKKLPYIKGERCIKCSKKISGAPGVCVDCRKKEHRYKQGYALFSYNRITERIIAGIKYSGKWNHAEWLTKELCYHSSMYIERWKPELILPVPLHRSRLRERGFNQAGIIAGQLSKAYNIQYADDLLMRNKKTKPQKNLDTEERAWNLADAFYVKQSAVKRYAGVRRVVLADDIYTTGSTINACADVLMKNGINEIYYIALCVGDGYSSI